MIRCYMRCTLLLIILAASAETASTQERKRVPPRALTGSGEQTLTMTEIGGQPAIRYSPAQLTLHFSLKS
jgi:hypothetical protein